MRVFPRVRPVALLGAALAAAVAVSVGSVHASSIPPDNTAITISPASSAPSLKPGGSQLYNISVLNNGNTSYNARLYSEPYNVVGINYDPSFSQLPGTVNAASWVKLSKQTIFVPAHETVVVPYTLAIPANTTPGGYYAVIFVETKPPKVSNVQAQNRVGDILYITAQGPVRTGGKIIGTPLPHITSATNLELSLEVSDTGSLHYLTKANISVINLFGKDVFTGSFERYVLPQTVRKISTSWKTPSLGIFKVSRQAIVAGHLQSLPDKWVVVIHPWVIVLAVIILALIFSLLILGRRTKR